MDAFKSRDPERPWAWFVQATRRVSLQDFHLLTRTCRAWAREKLGVSHVWLSKLFRKFEADPAEVRRLQAYGNPTLEQLNRARECTQRMRGRGELRNPRQRVPPLPPAFVESVRRRFAEGWSKSRLRRELLLDLDRKRVKKILEKVCSDVELVRQHRAAASIWWTRKQRE